MARAWVRDPERTRKAVLDAAEGLFARRGYATTSLQEIGREAGVSRNTPSYFFGSKEGLYVAVKERLANEVRAFAEEAGAARSGGKKGRDPRGAIAEMLRSYMDFLAANPNYVRLVEREASGEDAALEGGLIRTLGIDPDEPDFVGARKEHVVDLLMNGILEREADDEGERA